MMQLLFDWSEQFWYIQFLTLFLFYLDSDREDRESTSSSMSTANEKSTIGSAAYITSSLCSGNAFDSPAAVYLKTNLHLGDLVHT